MYRISVRLTDYLIVNGIIADDVREDHIYGFEVLFWQIWGSVEYSNYFTWKPRYFIQYKFFVTPLTIRFL